MFPKLLEIGTISIYSYGCFMAIAFLLAIWLAVHRAKSCGANPQYILDLGLISLIFGIVGGRLFYVVLNIKYFLESPGQIAMIHKGGLVFYGGLLLALSGCWVYLKIKKESFLEYSDICTPSIVIGHAVGRIGCFLNGCCYGGPTSLPWGVTFPEGSLPSAVFGVGHCIHPVQIYSATALLLMYVFLSYMFKKRQYRGEILFLYLLIYGFVRFLIEFGRADLPKTTLGWMSPTQAFAVIVFLVGFVGLYAIRAAGTKIRE
ncbi:MAG: prolipoprotein diacylglyceryl transferase [Candidatus Theseobacter exili]|nr:prolipoprotein diacylglyceryl transferase [Candidatus Theseobacter exili]